MTDDSRYLRRQFETAWLLTDLHLTGLETDECLWRPAAEGLHGEWLAALDQLTDADFASNRLTRWPFRERPFGDVVAWVNVELTKNAAEIGYARFLYAVRR